jgi:glycosyltransferase involved in cell wall biosynthesis
MKLGIVITSYNDQDTLKDVIESASNFNKNKNHIVLVDDCSTDSTINIANHAKKNNQIDLLHFNKKNLGVSSCRNIGINLCRNTDYITFLDGDDFLYYGSPAILNLKEIYTDLIVFNFNYLYKNMIIKNNFYGIDRKLEVNDIKEYFHNYLVKPNKNSLFTTCWGKLYRTKLFLTNENLYFNEKLRLCEDTDFVFRFLTNSKSVQYINFPIYEHTLGYAKQNLNKATFGINLELSHQISFLVAVESCKKYLIENGDFLSEIQNKLDHCIGAYTIIYTIRSCMKINSFPDFIKTYLFWKNFYNRESISHAIKNYSYKCAGGSWLLPFLIKNKIYFIAIIIAYFISKKRYL